MRAAHVVGERKIVTTLFADVVDSTALARSVGAEEWAAIMSRAFEWMSFSIDQFGGTLARLMGDALLAFFGAPTAHEDDALRGVSAGLSLVEAARKFGAEVHADYGIEFGVRVGVSTGPVVVGDVGSELLFEYTAMGDPVNLAARLQSATSPMTVLLEEDTYRAVQSAIRCEDRGLLVVKGMPQPVHTYRALEVNPVGQFRAAARDRMGPLVGRQSELALICDRLQQLATGSGGMLIMAGEAGVGKSRLLAAARRSPPAGRVHWLQGHTMWFGQTISYWPFLEMLREATGITETDAATSSWDKLAEWANALLGPEAEDLLAYLGALLAIELPHPHAARVRDLTGESLGPQVFRAMRKLVSALAIDRPTVLAVEDVQWLDQSSRGLLQHLLPITSELPLLVLVTERSDPDTLATELFTVARKTCPERVSELTVAPMNVEDSTRLIEQLLETDNIQTGARELIHRRAEGNPFFVEEVVHALIEQKALVRDPATASWKLAGSVADVAVPDTVQGVLLARLDRLEPDVREVLRVASVIGRTFYRRLLGAMADADGTVDVHLEELEWLDLIRKRHHLPEPEYAFKHALTQEATYGGILLRRRRELHRLAGQAIEALFADRLEEFYSLLAYHFGQGELWAKAHEYLLKAGDQAAKLAADTEALTHYERALEVHARAFGEQWDPLERAALERKMGAALMRRGAYEQANQHLVRALARVGGTYPRASRGITVAILRQAVRQVWHRVSPFRTRRRAQSPAERFAAEERARIYERIVDVAFFADPEGWVLASLLALNDAESCDVVEGITLGSFVLALVCSAMGVRGADGYNRRALAGAQLTGLPRHIALAYFGLANQQHHATGDWDGAVESYRHAASVNWQAGELRYWFFAVSQHAIVMSLRGELAKASEVMRNCLDTARDAGDDVVTAWAEATLGLVLSWPGDLDEAVGLHVSAIQFLDHVPDYLAATLARGWLARCYVRRGNPALAVEVADAAILSIARHKLRGFCCGPAWLGLAEARVALLEQARGPERPIALREAVQACTRAVAASNLDWESRPGAYRASGDCCWLRGKPNAAHRLWGRSLDVAERLGARYEVGLTLLDMGRHSGDHVAVARAEKLFCAMGAEFDRRRACGALEGCIPETS
jgi:class 3 adenylate cyclase/tetratricopeptide (TPR) repeat protein